MNDFMKSKEIAGWCYCNVNEYICASLRAHGAGFFPAVSIAQMESHKVNCLTRLSSSAEM